MPVQFSVRRRLATLGWVGWVMSRCLSEKLPRSETPWIILVLRFDLATLLLDLCHQWRLCQISNIQQLLHLFYIALPSAAASIYTAHLDLQWSSAPAFSRQGAWFSWQQRPEPRHQLIKRGNQRCPLRLGTSVFLTLRSCSLPVCEDSA